MLEYVRKKKEDGSLGLGEFGVDCSHFLIVVFADLKKFNFMSKFIDLGAE